MMKAAFLNDHLSQRWSARFPCYIKVEARGEGGGLFGWDGIDGGGEDSKLEPLANAMHKSSNQLSLYMSKAVSLKQKGYLMRLLPIQAYAVS